MDKNNQVVKYNNPIKSWIINILNKIKNKFGLKKSNTLDKATEYNINLTFSDESEREYAKSLLQDLLTRNNDLLETLDLRMLDKKILGLFGKAKLERIITDPDLQKELLGLSYKELQTYAYLLNYKLVNFNDRVTELSVMACENIGLEELQKLSQREQVKAVSIILSDSSFKLRNISELKDYYENRKQYVAR